MQLNAPGTGSVRAALAAASAALLAPVTPAVAQSAAPEWKVDSALLLYQENGGRVRAIEPVVSARRTDGNDRSWGLKVTYDALTGASPNGAVAQPSAQTFTSPSGNSTYTVDAGKQPLDPSFHDSRVALNGSHERSFGAAKLSTGLNVSNEYDFQSLGGNAALAWDLNDRNTTVSLGLAFEADRIKAVGGAPQPLTPAFTGAATRGGQSRNVTDLLLGVTQLMSPTWLVQVNLGLGRSSGMHEDPYKILSVVDGNTGLVTGDRYVYESRPRSRTRTSLYAQSKTAFKDDVLDVSYRYYRDDWGVNAHTVDLRYRVALGGGWHLEPLVRLYRQTAADFWRGWLVEGTDWTSATNSAGVANASADPRLGAFSANTVGLKLGVPLNAASELSLRLASYKQTFKRPADAPGVLSTLNVAPGMTATTFVVGYTRDF